MKKLAKDHNVLTDAQIDKMMLALEAAHAETGNKNVLKVLDIITEKQPRFSRKDTCPNCTLRIHCERGYCKSCNKLS